jgi:DnaJ-domain-containing protein 1
MSERLNDGFDDLFTMPIVSEDDTLSDPLNKEKEEKKKENTFDDGFDDLFSDSFDKPLDIPEPLSGPEPSFLRKFDYGQEQEQTILGNLAQSFVAGAKSLTRSGLTFEEALRESERQRQEDIFKEYPEFKNRPEDAAVISGRIAQALVDPLPWLIPWTKIAQAGRAATVTTGAGFSVGDVALREKVLYGEVDPSSVLMAGVFGGAATYGADVIARKFMKPDTALDAEFVDASGTVKTLPSKIKDEPDYVATPEEQDVLNEVGRERLESKSKAQEIFDSGPDSYEVVKSASLKISSYEELDSPLKITKRIEELKKLGVNVSRTQLEREAALRKVEAVEARKTLSSQTKKLVQTATDYAKEQLDDLEKTGTKITLSDGLIRKFVYEGTRPLFGGVSGAVAGSYLGEDDDDMLMYSLIGLGAALGAWQGQVQRSKFLTKPQKQIIKDTLDQEARLATNTWLKINTAGTHAARLNAWGGASSLFSKLMYKQMGASLTTAGAMPVEQRSIANVGKLFNIIHEDVLRNVPREMLEDVGKFRNGFTTLDDLAKKYTPDELTLIQQASQNIKDFTDELGEAVSEVGIDFKLLENYGLTQMWDWDKISKNAETFGYRLKEAWAVQTYKLDPTDTDAIRKAIEEGGDVFENQVTDVMSGLAGTRATTAFDDSGNVVIPLLKNFEKERVITDQNARVMLQDYIINDPSKTLGHLVSQTIPSYEFAKTFGAKGELLKTIRREIHQKYNPTRQGTKTTELEQKEIQHIKDSVNAYFGLYGNRLSNETGHIMMAGLTMLGNSTMLTRVAIPSLGDLIQPLQNSGFMPVIKTYAAKAKAGKLLGGKQDTFSSEGLGIKYQNVLESELQAIGFGVDPSNRAGRMISNFNSNFFKIVQLKRITDFARGAAYDAGVFRAYDIAKRVGKGKKISDSLQNEINALGLKTDELLKISKFKNAREAYDNVETKQFLHKAGFNSSERDAIIPTVGNRLLFAQSNNPFVRSLGQFLSWAQAKTTQTNALVSRLEDGDAALALRMLAALSIYGGVREMQIAFSPSEYYKDEANVPERWSTKYALEALKLSGNFVPFQVEKVLGLVSGPGASEGLGGAIPSLGLTNDLIKAAVSVPTNVYQGDLEGAASDILDVTPFGRDFKNVLSGDFPIQPIEIYDIKDEPKSSGKTKRRQYAEGREVNVPYTKDEPEERINPFTGRPYTDAYQRRTGLNDGGRVPFGLGAAVASLARQATKYKKVDESKEALEALGVDDIWRQNWDKEREIIVAERQKEWGMNNKLIRKPEVEESLAKLANNEKDIYDHIKVVSQVDPVENWKFVPPVASQLDIAGALDKNKLKNGIVYLNKNIEENKTVGLRLDIPAYKNKDVWVASIHPKGEKTVYAQTGWIKNAVFGNEKLSEKSYKIAAGKEKSPIAVIEGQWKNHDPEALQKMAMQLLNDPEWTQVGYNPFRVGYFYDRSDLMPVISASEVIQVGPFVIAKNVKKAKPTDKRFEIEVDDKKFNFNQGGLSQGMSPEDEAHLVYKMLGS